MSRGYSIEKVADKLDISDLLSGYNEWANDECRISKVVGKVLYGSDFRKHVFDCFDAAYFTLDDYKNVLTFRDDDDLREYIYDDTEFIGDGPTSSCTTE